MRGRVMAILLAIALGGTPVGAPLVGWVSDHFGPRWGLGVGRCLGLLGRARRPRRRHARVAEDGGAGALAGASGIDTIALCKICALKPPLRRRPKTGESGWAFYWRGLFAGFQSPGLKVYSR